LDASLVSPRGGAHVGALWRLGGGLSRVYFFYAPEAARRSLSNFIVLGQIEKARRLGLPHGAVSLRSAAGLVWVDHLEDAFRCIKP
jgi:hypothetical protein